MLKHYLVPLPFHFSFRSMVKILRKLQDVIQVLGPLSHKLNNRLEFQTLGFGMDTPEILWLSG